MDDFWSWYNYRCYFYSEKVGNKVDARDFGRTPNSRIMFVLLPLDTNKNRVDAGFAQCICRYDPTHMKTGEE